MNLWVDVPSLRIMSQHGSAVIGAIGLFKGIASLVAWGFPEGFLRCFLETLDSFVLVGLIAWFAYQMGFLLWLGRVGRGFRNVLAA